MYCIKFLADEEKSNQDQEISQELTNLYENEGNAFNKTFVTRGMLYPRFMASIWEKESKEH